MRRPASGRDASGKALREAFGAMPRSRIALEIGTHSPWISRLLSELGHEVMVANARKVRLMGESRKKDDRWVDSWRCIKHWECGDYYINLLRVNLRRDAPPDGALDYVIDGLPADFELFCQ